MVHYTTLESANIIILRDLAATIVSYLHAWTNMARKPMLLLPSFIGTRAMTLSSRFVSSNISHVQEINLVVRTWTLETDLHPLKHLSQHRYLFRQLRGDS